MLAECFFLLFYLLTKPNQSRTFLTSALRLYVHPFVRPSAYKRMADLILAIEWLKEWFFQTPLNEKTVNFHLKRAPVFFMKTSLVLILHFKVAQIWTNWRTLSLQRWASTPSRLTWLASTSWPTRRWWLPWIRFLDWEVWQCCMLKMELLFK